MLTPAQIMERLESIEVDLADRQSGFERVAEDWTRAKREKALEWARAFTESNGGSVTERKADAIKASEHIGITEEAQYTALRGVVEVLTTRATIGQSLLRAHGRAS